MTQDLLVNIGEEYFVTEGADGATVIVGLYDDAVDNLDDTSNEVDITSEPTNTNYARESSTVTASNIEGNWGVENDVTLTFDFSDTTDDNMEVDTAFVLVNFDSTEAGGLGDHLIANPALSQRRSLGSIDTLEIGVGDLEIKLD